MQYCENLELGGYADWRLPTAREQERIVDLGKSNPAVDTQFFPNTQSAIYWSGTSCAGCHKFKALSIDYSDGEMYFGVKYRDGVYGENYERCVRGGQCIDSDGDTVCDNFDNCPNICNTQQLNADNDLTGDVCDSTPGCGGCGQIDCEVSCEGDADSDGIPDVADNCPGICNPSQLDADNDLTGDACDSTPGCGGCGQPDCEADC